MFVLCGAIDEVKNSGVKRSQYEQIHDQMATNNKGIQ